MSNDLQCPVDHITVNETKVRLIAFFAGVLGLLCFITANWAIAALLLVDFMLRAFNFNNYSPLSIISGELIKLFKLKNKPVDRAPKRFAAFMGMAFVAMILLALLINQVTAAKVVIGILLVFASLESFAGFCAGCYVYSLLKRVNLIK